MSATCPIAFGQGPPRLLTIRRPTVNRLVVAVKATSDPPPQIADSAAAEDIGGLGRAVLTVLTSNNGPKSQSSTEGRNSRPKQPQQQKQKREKEKEKEEGGEEGRELSGSDVLWALQRAAAQKKKKKKKSSGGKKNKKGATSVKISNNVGANVEDYSNYRPLNVNSKWASRLDDLERRLQELSEI